jgi:hypothetical protein
VSRRPGRLVGSVGFAVLWLLALGLLQWSVVRFEVPIVLGVTAAAAALAWWVVRRRPLDLDRRVAAAILLGGAAILVVVPMFSYLRGDGRTLAVALLAAAAVLGACLLLLPSPRAAAVAAALGAATYVAVTAVAIRVDPAPRIDVWVILQQAADLLAHGENIYSATWQGSPGIKDAFTYLPWSAVLLAPGKLLLGDVRWSFVLWSLVAFGAVWLLRRSLPAGRQWLAAFVILALATAPGTLTQVDQSWTEPLLLAGLAVWLLLVVRGHAWWAVLPLALACASKQHLALLLPILLVWRPFGWRRTLATGALTGALIAPWFIAGPKDFLDDTVTLLVGFHPIRFANTWYLYFLNEHGVALPFWVTGLVVLGALAAAVVLVARRQPPPAELVRWLALVLLAANLVNKQAFYNQYWLSAALVALSLVAPEREPEVTGSVPTPELATAR